jgi:hypothetical protein
MSDEPKQRSSRAGLILVLLAVGGSAIGVVGWHMASNRNAGLDTSGFDMSTTPDPAHSAAPPFFAPSARSAPWASAPAQQTSLGMVKGDEGMRVVGPGASTPTKRAGASGAEKAPANPKEAAALSFKEAAIKNEKIVDAFVRKMQTKYPSIGRYGRDWAASPELRALRDQYWKEKDPLKFAYGLAKSGDFGKLIKKYATDAGIRDTLIQGIKEAPPGLISAVGGVAQNDKVSKDLLTTIIGAVGLPKSLTGFLDGSDAKAPDQNQVMSDIMNSDDMKKAMKNPPQGAVPLDQKDVDKAKEAAPNNGFTPLGSGRR